MSSAGKRVAEILRDAEPELDELRRARIERRFLEVASARAEGAPPTLLAPPARSRWPQLAVGGAVVALAAAAFLVFRAPTGPHYTISHVRGAPIAAGTVIEVAPGDEARAEVHHLEVVATAGASVRFASVDGDDVRLYLARGAARFAFHPEVRGEEHVTIETPSARVEIVGTVLSVRVDAAGTEVSVDEGRVRVVPADGGAETFVAAGEHVLVAIPAATAAAAEAEPVAVAAAEPVAEAEPVADAVAAAEAVAASPSAPVAASVDGELAPEHRAESAAERLARLDEALDDAPHETRRELAELGASSAPRSVRVDAYLLLGDSYRDEHANEAAVDAYASAARIGRGTVRGAQARYERARLFEAMARPDQARDEYARYLDEYPSGAHAADARARHEALSR